METVYDFEVPTLDGKTESLGKYTGMILLIVNTASKGIHKRMLRKLEQIQSIFGERSFAVLAFPCRQFFKLEQKNNAEIEDYYCTKHKFSFRVFGKIKVNGHDAHPLFVWLKKRSQSRQVLWNFNRYLVLSDGTTVIKFKSTSAWSDIAWEIDQQLRRIEIPTSLSPEQATSLDQYSESESETEQEDSMDEIFQ